MRLTTRQRSQLFSQLATLEHAGIPPAQAFAMIGRLPSVTQQALARTATILMQGTELATAGQNSQILLPWEAQLVRAAATSGRLETLYSHLGEHYARSDRRFTESK